MLQLDDFYHARSVLHQVLRPTALVQARKINPEMEVYLKPECLQRTGSFKVRGAYYKISQLSDAEKAKGVIACSAGNHAQGVALAATSMGVKSLICLPESAPISKIEATRRLGAEVCLVPGVYDDAHVIAGQGTIGLELIETLVPIVKGERKRRKREEQAKKRYRKKPTDTVRLCADDIMTRLKWKSYQDTYAIAMAKYGLQRGIDGSTARHKSTQQYYRDTQKLVDSLKAEVVDLQERKEATQQELI